MWSFTKFCAVLLERKDLQLTRLLWPCFAASATRSILTSRQHWVMRWCPILMAWLWCLVVPALAPLDKSPGRVRQPHSPCKQEDGAWGALQGQSIIMVVVIMLATGGELPFMLMAEFKLHVHVGKLKFKLNLHVQEWMLKFKLNLHHVRELKFKRNLCRRQCHRDLALGKKKLKLTKSNQVHHWCHQDHALGKKFRLQLMPNQHHWCHHALGKKFRLQLMPCPCTSWRCLIQWCVIFVANGSMACFNSLNIKQEGNVLDVNWRFWIRWSLLHDDGIRWSLFSDQQLYSFSDAWESSEIPYACVSEHDNDKMHGNLQDTSALFRAHLFRRPVSKRICFVWVIH